jgi:hypothetical protein
MKTVIYVDRIDEEVMTTNPFNTEILPRPGTSLAKFLCCPEKEDGRTVDDVDLVSMTRLFCLC